MYHMAIGLVLCYPGHAVNLGVALVLILLVAALILGHSLEIRHIQVLHDAGGDLLIGVEGGAVLRLTGGEGSGPLAVTHATILVSVKPVLYDCAHSVHHTSSSLCIISRLHALSLILSVSAQLSTDYRQ